MLVGPFLNAGHYTYAVRTDDLFQMPDGIFEIALGTYYMAVRVINRWGLPFTEDNVLDITAPSRAELFRDTCSAKRVIADTGEDICIGGALAENTI